MIHVTHLTHLPHLTHGGIPIGDPPVGIPSQIQIEYRGDRSGRGTKVLQSWEGAWSDFRGPGARWGGGYDGRVLPALTPGRLLRGEHLVGFAPQSCVKHVSYHWYTQWCV